MHLEVIIGTRTLKKDSEEDSLILKTKKKQTKKTPKTPWIINHHVRDKQKTQQYKN